MALLPLHFLLVILLHMTLEAFIVGKNLFTVLTLLFFVIIVSVAVKIFRKLLTNVTKALLSVGKI